MKYKEKEKIIPVIELSMEYFSVESEMMILVKQK